MADKNNKQPPKPANPTQERLWGQTKQPVIVTGIKVPQLDPEKQAKLDAMWAKENESEGEDGEGGDGNGEDDDGGNGAVMSSEEEDNVIPESELPGAEVGSTTGAALDTAKEQGKTRIERRRHKLKKIGGKRKKKGYYKIKSEWSKSKKPSE